MCILRKSASCGKKQTTANTTASNNYPPQSNAYVSQQGYVNAAGVGTDYQQMQRTLLINKLCGKIKTEAIIWLVVACLQVLIGFMQIFYGIELNSIRYTKGTGTSNIFSGIIILVIAVINFIGAGSEFSYARDIRIRPVGIVKKYKPVGGLIWALIYNLIFGGIIGVVGIIFGFITRSFVLNNAVQLQIIEEEALKPQQQESYASANQWKCKQCGKVNENYVGTCACGNTKDKNI